MRAWNKTGWLPPTLHSGEHGNRAGRRSYGVRWFAFVGACVLAIGVGGLAARGRWRERQADVAFASLIQAAELLSPVALPAPSGRVGAGPVVVLVRTLTGATISPYHVETALPWPLAFATSSRDAKLVLLVDRILLNVRGYQSHGRFQPSGEDFQVVLHCALIGWPEQRTLMEFSVRGTMPTNREGMSTLVGLLNRVGSDPWPAAGERITAYLEL